MTDPLVQRRPFLRLVPWFACFGGLLFHFQPFWWSAFRLTHHGLGDGRLVNFTLEHGYRWLAGTELHENFWRPPIFFPYDRAGAFTDVVLGAAPPFWIARALGAAPDTALQIWMLVIHCFNFLCGYWLLHRGARLGLWASTAGATLLAAMSQVWTSHLQLYCLGFVLIAALALFRVFDHGDSAPDPKRRRLWVAAFFAAAVLQLWTAVYPFFFFGLLAGLALLVGLMMPAQRRRLLERWKQDVAVWIVAATVASLCSAPVVLRYLETASELGYRDYQLESLPTASSWVSIGPRDHLARRFGSPIPTATVPWGTGALVASLAIWGLLLGRRRVAVRILCAACPVVFLVGTNWFGFSLWPVVHQFVPGAGGIRATNRLPMVLIPVAVLGCSLAVQWLLDRKGGRLARFAPALIVTLACLTERAHVLGVIDKRAVRQHHQALAERVDSERSAFLLVGLGAGRWIADDAAWVAMTSGVPTVNGRYGNVPPGYGLAIHTAYEPGDDDARHRVEQALHRWLDLHGVAHDEVQWLEYRPLQEAPKGRKDFVRRWPFVFPR